MAGNIVPMHWQIKGSHFWRFWWGNDLSVNLPSLFLEAQVKKKKKRSCECRDRTSFLATVICLLLLEAQCRLNNPFSSGMSFSFTLKCTRDSEAFSSSSSLNIKIFSQPALLLRPIYHFCAPAHGPEPGSGEGDSRVMNRGHGKLFGRMGQMGGAPIQYAAHLESFVW